MVTLMSKVARQIPVPALTGRRVLSAYVFSDELDAHGVVLRLDDGSVLSVEFDYETRVMAEVVISASEDDESVVTNLME